MLCCKTEPVLVVTSVQGVLYSMYLSYKHCILTKALRKLIQRNPIDLSSLKTNLDIAIKFLLLKCKSAENPDLLTTVLRIKSKPPRRPVWALEIKSLRTVLFQPLVNLCKCSAPAAFYYLHVRASCLLCLLTHTSSEISLPHFSPPHRASLCVLRSLTLENFLS